MDFVAGMAALSQALDIAKQLREFEKDFKSAEYKLQVANLYSKLADAKMALADARELVEAKDRENATLRRAFQISQECVRHGIFLYDRDSNGDPTGTPYCSRCEQIDGVMIELTNTRSVDATCPQCKSHFGSVANFKRTTREAQE